MGKKVFMCSAEDMHPFNCDKPYGGDCRHCDRIKDETHDPATCALCDPEYDFQPNDQRPAAEALPPITH